jgi:hypothetical protein
MTATPQRAVTSFPFDIVEDATHAVRTFHLLKDLI